MALLEKLKSLLGLGPASRSTEAREVDVTVERETDDAATGGETSREPSITDEPASTEDDAADDSSAGGDDTGTDEPVIEEAESDGPAATDDGQAGEEVTEIKGIGPSYAERLSDAGVETIADLADADAGTLSEATDISETRISGWIERANAR